MSLPPVPLFSRTELVRLRGLLDPTESSSLLNSAQLATEKEPLTAGLRGGR